MIIVGAQQGELLALKFSLASNDNLVTVQTGEVLEIVGTGEVGNGKYTVNLDEVPTDFTILWHTKET